MSDCAYYGGGQSNLNDFHGEIILIKRKHRGHGIDLDMHIVVDARTGSRLMGLFGVAQQVQPAMFENRPGYLQIGV